MSDQNAALFDKLDGFYVTKSEHDWLERRFSNTCVAADVGPCFHGEMG